MALYFLRSHGRSDSFAQADFRAERQASIRRHLRQMAPAASPTRLEAASQELAWAAVELRVGYMDRFFLIAERGGCAGCCKWN